MKEIPSPVWKERSDEELAVGQGEFGRLVLVDRHAGAVAVEREEGCRGTSSLLLGRLRTVSLAGGQRCGWGPRPGATVRDSGTEE